MCNMSVGEGFSQQGASIAAKQNLVCTMYMSYMAVILVVRVCSVITRGIVDGPFGIMVSDQNRAITI